MFGFIFLVLVTLLGTTTSKTSGGTPRDVLETRCRALQVLSGRFTEDFGCEFGADFAVQIFVRRQTAESRIFKNRAKIQTLVAHDCGYPLSRDTCRTTRVAAAYLDFIAFCRCSTGVALHPLKIWCRTFPPPPSLCREVSHRNWV